MSDFDPTLEAAVWWKITDLHPWVDNPRKHPQSQVTGIALAIEKNGFGAPFIAHWPSRKIIAGHGRRLGMEALLKRSPGFTVPGSPGPGWVPVRFLGGTWKDARLGALADNRLAEEAEWERRALASVLHALAEEDMGVRELVERSGFDEATVEALLRMAEGPGPDADVEDPGARPAPTDRAAVSEPGRVYQLGPHRLACGSNLDPDLLAVLLEGVAPPRLMVTDPPYGIAYKSGIKSSSQGKARTRTATFGADEFDATFLGLLAPLLPRVEAVYLWTRWDVLQQWREAMRDAGWAPKQRLIWDKCHYTMGNLSIMGSQTEDCLFWCADTHQLRWEKREGNIWRVATGFIQEGGLVDHPTQKPLGLYRRSLELSSDVGDVVIDPFMGSGTCLISAAQIGHLPDLRCPDRAPGRRV